MIAVEWTEKALDQLADIYVNVPREMRNPVVAAVEAIDRYLCEYGLKAGESRSGSIRIFFHELLVVNYAVNTENRILVTRVRPNRRLRG
jgi:plasmid stabilization system protein ParE